MYALVSNYHMNLYQHLHMYTHYPGGPICVDLSSLLALYVRAGVALAGFPALQLTWARCSDQELR
jgi:hypothetical protein